MASLPLPQVALDRAIAAAKLPASTQTSPRSTKLSTTSPLMHLRLLSEESEPMVSASATTGGWVSKVPTSLPLTLLSLPITGSTQASTGLFDDLVSLCD